MDLLSLSANIFADDSSYVVSKPTFEYEIAFKFEIGSFGDLEVFLHSKYTDGCSIHFLQKHLIINHARNFVARYVQPE